MRWPLETDRRAAHRHHEHRAALPHGLVVEGDADHAFRSETSGLLLELRDRDLASLAELLLIGARSPAHDVSNAREEIPDDVRTEDRLARDETEVFANRLAFDRGRRGENHVRLALLALLSSCP